METNNWLVINTLADYIEQGRDENKLREATLQLDTDLDRRLVDNLPVEEINRLVEVLNRVNYEIGK